MSRGQKIAFRILFGLYILGLLLLCFGHFNSTPELPTELWGIPLDKLVHFLLFFPFPILAFLAFDQYTETVRATLRFTGITLLAGVLLAVGTELGQAFLTDYRAGEPLDLLADLLALLLSSALVAWWDIRKQRR